MNIEKIFDYARENNISVIVSHDKKEKIFNILENQ